MESILASIKKQLGLDANYTPFDYDIIVGINAAFATLNQLGVGPKEGFIVTGPDETWCEFIGGRADLGMVRQYVYLKTKYVFDPPQGGVLNAMNDVIKELEWRINTVVDPEDTYK